VAVPARVSLVTLGVADVERSATFYEGLGWKRSPASVSGEVAFFGTAGGLLALWRREALARDVGEPPGERGATAVTLAVNVDERAAVDAAFETVRAVGGRVIRPPEPTDWGGYVGYFADPDGHVWEVAHNPSWPIGDDGRPRLP
jgi:predicted lactoylglutathione lyase